MWSDCFAIISIYFTRKEKIDSTSDPQHCTSHGISQVRPAASSQWLNVWLFFSAGQLQRRTIGGSSSPISMLPARSNRQQIRSANVTSPSVGPRQFSHTKLYDDESIHCVCIFLAFFAHLTSENAILLFRWGPMEKNEWFDIVLY